MAALPDLKRYNIEVMAELPCTASTVEHKEHIALVSMCWPLGLSVSSVTGGLPMEKYSGHGLTVPIGICTRRENRSKALLSRLNHVRPDKGVLTCSRGAAFRRGPGGSAPSTPSASAACSRPCREPSITRRRYGSISWLRVAVPCSTMCCVSVAADSTSVTDLNGCTLLHQVHGRSNHVGHAVCSMLSYNVPLMSCRQSASVFHCAGTCGGGARSFCCQGRGAGEP